MLLKIFVLDVMDRRRKRNSAIPFLLTVLIALLLMLATKPMWSQVAVVQSPVPKFRDFLASGAPNASGCVYTFVTATNTPQATYTDSTGATPNSNPVQLDANGEASIWVTANVYRFQVWTFGGTTPLGANCGNGTQRYQIDGVSDKGLIGAAGGSLLLNPGGHVNQTVLGPITADQFTGPATQLLTSFSIPSRPTETYNIPTSGTTGGNVVVNPSGSGGTSNTLDCTLAGITCKRTAAFNFRGAQCNNVTAGIGWDTFPTNAPTPLCTAGTNVQKGSMGMPSAYTKIQGGSAFISASSPSIGLAYPSALAGGTGDLLLVAIVFNSTTTITGCTDGTNAYSQAKHVAVGALSLDIWYFLNATTKAAGTSVTCSFSVNAFAAMKFAEYLAPNTVALDVTASTSNAGACATIGTGTTASTAQATELAFAATGWNGTSTVAVTTNGYTDHIEQQSTVTILGVDDAGIIAQTIGGQTATFGFSPSPTGCAGAIATFKAANAGPAVAQQTIVLPAFFNSAQAINATAKFTVPAAPAGTSAATLSTALVCTVDGASDDPAMNADTTVSPAITNTGPNLPATVTFSGIAAGSCAAGQTLHFQLRRMRYNSTDNYEGFIQVIGAQLQVGVTQ